MTIPKLEDANAFFDKWRWVLGLVGLLGLMGASVVWPGARITRLEELRAEDRAQLDATTAYLRVLATAQCLSDQPKSDMLKHMCIRVLSDATVLVLPR